MWRTVLPDGLTNDNLTDAAALALPRARSCPFDPNAGLGLGAQVAQDAAYGDLASQRIMRDAMTEEAFSAGLGHPFALAYSTQMTLAARLCAAHRLPEDARRLAGALCRTSDTLRHLGHDKAADEVAGEGVMILERLSSAGDEYCALASTDIVSAYPATAAVARRLMNAEK
jgi:hypothetical protein